MSTAEQRLSVPRPSARAFSNRRGRLRLEARKADRPAVTPRFAAAIGSEASTASNAAWAPAGWA